MWKLWIYPISAFILAYAYRFLPCAGSLLVIGCALDHAFALLTVVLSLPVYFVLSKRYYKNALKKKRVPKLYVFLLFGVGAYALFPVYFSLLFIIMIIISNVRLAFR